MPVYTYRCENCGHQFDKEQSFSDDPLKACPECRMHALRKVYRPAGVVFKGSGFYVTDKRGKSSTTSAQPSNGSTEKKSEKKEKNGDSSTTSEKKSD